MQANRLAGLLGTAVGPVRTTVEVLTVRQVADLLNESIHTTRRRVRSGQIPSLNTGGQRQGSRYRIHPHDVDAYLKALPAGSARSGPTRTIA